MQDVLFLLHRDTNHCRQLPGGGRRKDWEFYVIEGLAGVKIPRQQRRLQEELVVEVIENPETGEDVATG
jgi:hypothetical protein